MADKDEIDEEGADGCSLPFSEEAATADGDLPAAGGGVAIEGEGDERDGCDLELDDYHAVTDEDLPASEGGVA